MDYAKFGNDYIKLQMVYLVNSVNSKTAESLMNTSQEKYKKNMPRKVLKHLKQN